MDLPQDNPSVKRILNKKWSRIKTDTELTPQLLSDYIYRLRQSKDGLLVSDLKVLLKFILEKEEKKKTWFCCCNGTGAS